MLFRSLSSVMVAISLCIKVRRRYTLTRPTAAHVAKIAMVYRIFQKVNGSAGSVLCRRRTLSYVSICIVASVEAHVRQSCILCPNEGGAFKQTVQGEWVHLLCAIWVPETRVANDVFMEPVTGVDRISKQRWKLVRPMVSRCSRVSNQLIPPRNVRYARYGKVHASNAPRRPAS